jgi:hypothetical protein
MRYGAGTASGRTMMRAPASRTRRWNSGESIMIVAAAARPIDRLGRQDEGRRQLIQVLALGLVPVRRTTHRLRRALRQARS